ncbi:calcium/sodium antiporter [Balneatrix alpica]|uniref:Calcium/sodium antiporter n=1 Tax=Balneatrix alpica TaxID=75684 RepID=A0ABV5ZAE3_9GAMM|nr:calcium/sodium antiporter [Balneatrix alpica]
MLLHLGVLITGLIVLVWSADKFILGASASARQLGVSTLVIGMFVVGFGTSAPELMVSTMAALDGNSLLAVGNALGSNITNISLILGVTAILMPISVASGIIRRELPMLLAITFAAALLLLDGHLGVMDGVILLASLVGVIWFTYKQSQQGGGDLLETEFEEQLNDQSMTLGKALMWTLIGLLLLLASSRALVWAAVELAQSFGISELVIGLTIVAIGTSLPELAASIVAARKGEADIAIGNVIGSNLFNLLGVMGIPGILAPVALGPEVLERDYLVMLGLSVLLFIFAFGWKRQGRINRLEGGLLLTCFAGYQWLLFS